MAVRQYDAYALDDNVKESITFCPLYFTNSYSNDILKRGKRPVTSLGEPELMTYEQNVLHGLSHCWYQLGGPLGTPVVDLLNRFASNAKVYGARSAGIEWAWVCQNFGHRYC